MDHPNVRSCWTKVRLDLNALDTVFMIETDPIIKRSLVSCRRSEPTSPTIPIMTGPKSFPFEVGENLAHTL